MILPEEAKAVVEAQRLGFVATVCPDGSPNVSPKGTTAVWDDTHLVFADIRSPQTVENLKHDPRVEINVVDPILRKGYRFRGTATVLHEGAMFEEAIAFYRARGTTNPIQTIVLIQVEVAEPLTSPTYDLGQSEAEVKAKWLARHRQLYGLPPSPPRRNE